MGGDDDFGRVFLGEFHGLMNCLNAVSGFAQLLMLDPLSEAQMGHVDAIGAAARELVDAMAALRERAESSGS